MTYIRRWEAEFWKLRKLQTGKEGLVTAWKDDCLFGSTEDLKGDLTFG